MKKIIPVFVVLALLLGFSLKNQQVEFIGRAFYYILYKYVEKLEPAKVIENGIRGMAKRAHSSFIESPVETYKNRDKLLLPGFQAFYSRDAMIIKEVFKETDAERKGLKKGDLLVEVDGFPLRLATAREALWRLYGEEGTTVTLRVLRKMKIHDFKVVRDFPRRDFVLKKKRLIIYRLFKDTVNEIKESILNRKKLIIDLRYFIDGDWKASLALGSYLARRKTTVQLINGEEKKSFIFRGNFPGKIVIVTDHSCTGPCLVLAAPLQASGISLLSPSQDLTGGCALSPIKFEQNKLLLIPTIGIKVNGTDICKKKIKTTMVKEKILIKEARARLEGRKL